MTNASFELDQKRIPSLVFFNPLSAKPLSKKSVFRLLKF